MKRPCLLAPLPLLAVALVLTAVWLGWLGTSASAGVNSRFSSQGAEAGFYSVDGSGIQTSLYLFAENAASQSPPGSGDSFSRLFVDVIRFDPATGNSTEFHGDAELPPGALMVNRKLTQATLQASGTICGYLSEGPGPTPTATPTAIAARRAAQEPTATPPASPTPPPSEYVCFDGAVDLVWQGSGSLSRSINHYHFKSEDFIDNSRCSESGRYAVATGSVTAIVDSMPLEFAPNASEWGDLFSRSCHDVFVD